MIRCLCYLGLACAVILIDQVTKYFIHQHFPLPSPWTYAYPFGGIGVFSDFLGIQFSIHYVTNHGAAWGAFGEYQHWLLAVRILLILGMVYYLLAVNKQRKWVLPLTLVLAGATSNVIDYFIYGYVVDMFHFSFFGHDFPVFNVADSAVTLGVVGLGILILLDKEQRSQHA